MKHPILRPSYAENIQHLFTAQDAGCMSWAIDLASYESIKANAAKISEWIGSGRMPPPDEGRAWSADKLKTFRNWAQNTGYAEQAFVRLRPSEKKRVRRNILDLSSEEVALLQKAFKEIMARDADGDAPQSFFTLAGIHWLPGPATNTYCRHHDDAYNPWHRAYLMAFEDALRSIEGCEDVTLPYWDILGDALPDWVYDAPLHPYTLPRGLTGLDGSEAFPKGYVTKRDSAATIVQNVKAAKADIEVKIGEAINADTWRGFNGWSDWPNQHEGIIRAHDNGHGACGPTIANQDVAAFDPLFWFFHCNWDRLWWKWQTDKHLTSLLAFKGVVTGDDHWLQEAPDTLLAPFDVNAAEMIDLSEWNVGYEHPAESFDFDELIARSNGSVTASKSFSLSAPEKYSVRIKDINRLDIPGSFSVLLYAGEKVIGKTRIFQPSEPRQCANCSKHGVFSTDFIVEMADLSGNRELRVEILVADKRGGETVFPLSRAGTPTINVRLLLDAQ